MVKLVIRNSLLAVCALSINFDSQPCQAADRPQMWAKDVASEIHALLVYSSDAAGTSKDADEMERVLEKTFRTPKHFPAGWPMVPLRLEKRKNATREDILRWCRGLRVKKKATVLVFYSGHGGTNSRGHYLALPAGAMYRDELRQEMVRCGGRLTVLITDCCATFTEGRSDLPKAQLKWKVLYGLLARHHGLVDINSARTGTSAWGDREGGVFTRTLTHLLCVAPTDIGGTKDYAEGMVPWRVFAQYLNDRTNHAFQKYRGEALRQPLSDRDRRELEEQLTQYPEFHSLPPLKLGLELTQVRGGLVVRTAISGLPASSAGIRERDAVIAINGRPVATEAEYAQIVDSFTGRQMRIRIVRKGVERDVNVALGL